MNLLTSFLTDAGIDAAGRTHADNIAMTDEELENNHDFIQWLFPLPEPSRAVPKLTGPDAEGIDNSPSIRSSPPAHSRSSRAHVAFLRRKQ